MGISEYKIIKESVKFIPPKKSKDVVTVVRCKDCVYGMMFKNVRDEQRIDCMSPTNNGTYVEAHDPDWFCADGRRI